MVYSDSDTEEEFAPNVKRCKNEETFEFSLPSVAPFTMTLDPPKPVPLDIPKPAPSKAPPAPTVESFFDDLTFAQDEHRDVLAKVNELYIDELKDLLGELGEGHDIDLQGMQNALHIMNIIKGVKNGQRYQPVDSGRWWKNIVIGASCVMAYVYM